MSELPDSGTPPSRAAAGYDDRYLAGIVCFNRGDYFEAHEVWEDLWMDCVSADRRFFQSLIQAAVSLYHWGNGNRAGADRLFHSGKRYMEPFRPSYHGLDVANFWEDVEKELSTDPSPLPPPRSGEGEQELDSPAPLPASGRGRGRGLPLIAIDPPPARWPDVPEVHHE